MGTKSTTAAFVASRVTGSLDIGKMHSGDDSNHSYLLKTQLFNFLANMGYMSVKD